ncbi:MAG: DUF1015 domain-containing protein [Bryobacteraceae bacterium]
MARIFPFRPWRYSEAAGPIENLVTQPYDKISPAMRTRYLELSPYNLVRLILGERFESDTESENVYTRAAGYLRQWMEQGVLRQEAEPSLYVYFQNFTEPDTGEKLTRKGFITLGALEEYDAQVVHRHEQTLSGPKKDRTELLNHTQAHFGQIFLLYPDGEGAVDAILDEVAASRAADVELTDDYGELNRVWRVSDAETIARVQAAMADKKLLIADGHHRYETALAFSKAHAELPGADKVMMTLVNMYNPGLRILATHRVLSNVAGFDGQRLVDALGGRSVPDVAALRALWAEPHSDTIRIGAVLRGVEGVTVFESPREGRLDVKVLHETILRDLMGINEEAVRDEKYIRYVRGAEAAAEMVTSGDAQAAFLLEAPTVDQVAEVSFGGGVMPQKSTDFYPKMLSGLTIYKL